MLDIHEGEKGRTTGGARILRMALMALMTVAPSMAQEVRPFAVTDVKGYLELHLKSEEESRTSADESILWDSKELEIRESLRLDVDGYFYHPRLVEYHVGGLFESIRNQISGSGMDDDGDDSVYPVGGDFRLTFFQQHPLTLTLFGDHTELKVDPLFSRSYLLESDSYGATLNLTKGPLPTEISYSHNSYQGFGSGVDANETNDDLLIRSHYRLGELSEGDIEYHMTHVQEEDPFYAQSNDSDWLSYGPNARAYLQNRIDSFTVGPFDLNLRQVLNLPFDRFGQQLTPPTWKNSDIVRRFAELDNSVGARTFDTQQFTVTNTTYLGAKKKIRLTGNARIHEQSGTTDSSTLALRENLEWKHTDKLQSRYYVSFDRSKVSDESVDVWGAGASVQHRLYESLQTNAEVYGRMQDASYGKTTTYGGSLTESYTKRLGEWGQMGLSVQGFAEVVDSQPDQEMAWIYDEPHVARLVLPIELMHRDIALESIRVTDGRGIRWYHVLLDYNVIPHGDYVSILPLPRGNIADGSTILVNYRYKLAGRGTILSTGGQLSAQLRVGRWLSLHGRYERSEQELLDGLPGTRLESLDRRVAGAQLAWRWLTIGAEYQDTDSVFSPGQSLSEWISVTGKLPRRVQAQLSVTHRNSSYEITSPDRTTPDLHQLLLRRGTIIQDALTQWRSALDFRNPNRAESVWFNDYGERTMDAIEVNGTLSVPLSARSRIFIEADYRQQTWNAEDAINDLEAYELRAGYSWQFRQLSVEAAARASMTDQHGQKEEFLRFEVGVRRRF